LSSFFGYCGTILAAIPMSYTSDADNEYSTSRNLENNILSLNLLFIGRKEKKS
jgi:hypothetical protein